MWESAGTFCWGLYWQQSINLFAQMKFIYQEFLYLENFWVKASPRVKLKTLFIYRNDYDFKLRCIFRI